MRICIDITCLAVDDWTGVQNSYYNLVKEFIQANTDYQFIIFALSPKGLTQKLENLDINNFKNTRTFIKAVPQKLFIPTLSFVQQYQFPFMNLFFGDVDVYLSGGYFWLPTKSHLSICVIHDLCDDMNILEFDRLKYASKFADKFITPSESTKSDAIKSLKINTKKIETIHWGLDITRFDNLKPKAIKNLKNKSFFLIFDGAKRKNFKNTQKAFEKAKIKEELFVLGNGKHVTESEYLWLLQNMKGLIYASTCEGFGLPILESYYFGKPVLTSNISSMPEIAGDAAIYCDPFDIESISKGIKKLLKTKLNTKKANVHLSKFSYKESAKKLDNLINKNFK